MGVWGGGADCFFSVLMDFVVPVNISWHTVDGLTFQAGGEE